MTFDPQRPDQRQQQIAAFYDAYNIPTGRLRFDGLGRLMASLRASLKAGAAQPHVNVGQGSRPDPHMATAANAEQADAAAQAQDPAAAESAASAAGPDADATGDVMADLAASSLIVVHTAPAPVADPGAPEPTAFTLPTAPGDEGGTAKIAAAERAPPEVPRASWWTRAKEARARRRRRIDERPQRTRARRISIMSRKVIGYGVVLVYGVGNLTEPLAAAYFGGDNSVAEALVANAGIMIVGNGPRPVFVRPPWADRNDPSRAHLPQAARRTENLQKVTFMATVLEDRRALSPAWSLTRVHGTDTLALGKAAWSQIAAMIWSDTRLRGGSTVPVTTCSIALGTMSMPDSLISKLDAKVREHLCAARLEAETHGDTTAQAAMMLDNAALVIGGGADTQGVTLASWQLFSREFSAIDQDCHLAVMAAAVNLPFFVPGESTASREAATDRLEALVGRAQHGLEELRESQGAKLNDADRTCFAELSTLLDRRFRNPAGDMNRTFGAAAPHIAAEAFAYRDRHPGTVQLTARFDAFSNETAMQRVRDAACAIARRRTLRLNICPQDGPVDRAQVRVIAVERTGAIHRMVAIGAGAASVLRENEDGELPGRGSVGKGILLPVLADNLFCRFDYPALEDADGVRGVDHECRPDELIPAAYAVRTSLNQPLLYALEHTEQNRLHRFRDALGLHQRELRDLVLGNRPAATQILMRDYLAVTSPTRVAALPHFFVEAGGPSVDLSGLISEADVARTRQLLSEPVKQGGTAHAAAARLQAAGYTVVWAKTGTSEAGLFADERGKHLIAELRDPQGRSLVVFAEIASADSSAIGGSRALTSADLADIILATLNLES